MTTKQGYLAVVFKREDFKVKLAERCEYALTHYNPKHLYTDLDNEYDHATVLSKAKMYVEGQLMRFLTRGSLAKVKVQVNLTKEKSQLVWIGYDKDENGEGKWLFIQYEGVPDYCNYCKHHGHDYNACEVKGRDEEAKRIKEQEEKRKNKNSEDDQANKCIKEQTLEQREHNKKMDEQTQLKSNGKLKKRKGWKNNQQNQ
ncbi:hypothetical protein H5410_047173 [Solanum commersonii]|uniref:DUF4283 domain-containing protein n=1 Tax=Solanum commersonii TaxID=4109 RepID=A0A9J5XED8_SOLCO|nr:hypothetical protein H5410_047173 [Solanum commersonii]